MPGGVPDIPDFDEYEAELERLQRLRKKQLPDMNMKKCMEKKRRWNIMQEISVIVEQENGVIGFNFEEIREKLASEMKFYKGTVVTKETVKDDKKTVASLRKLKTEMSDKRIAVKREFMQPYTEFEAKVKELNALIDEPIELINEQLEVFERKRVKERKQFIQAIYMENISDMEDILPLSEVYNPKWESESTSKKVIAEAINARMAAVKKDLETIKAMESEFEDKGIGKYKRTLSLSDAIQTIHGFEKQQKEILERQKQQEAAKKEEQEAAERAISSEQVFQPEPAVPDIDFAAQSGKPVNSAPLAANKTAKKNGITVYEVEADAFQLAQLEAAMREYEISYRRVE